MTRSLLTSQSLISAYARAHRLSLPMSLMAEQLFRFAATAGWDLGDDTSLINLYVPQRLHHNGQGLISIEDIPTLLFGIHTAASVEALSFARALEADWPSLASVVKDAAGASKAFEILLENTGTEKAPEKIASEELTALGTKMVSCPLAIVKCNR